MNNIDPKNKITNADHFDSLPDGSSSSEDKKTPMEKDYRSDVIPEKIVSNSEINPTDTPEL